MSRTTSCTCLFLIELTESETNTSMTDFNEYCVTTNSTLKSPSSLCYGDHLGLMCRFLNQLMINGSTSESQLER